DGGDDGPPRRAVEAVVLLRTLPAVAQPPNEVGGILLEGLPARRREVRRTALGVGEDVRGGADEVGGGDVAHLPAEDALATVKLGLRDGGALVEAGVPELGEVLRAHEVVVVLPDVDEVGPA